MARFDVHRDGAGRVPYLVDVQADFLSTLDTRLVVPLLREDRVEAAVPRLHPRFELHDGRFVLATNLMASVRRSRLGKVAGSLAAERDEITAAIDFLLQGF